MVELFELQESVALQSATSSRLWRAYRILDQRYQQELELRGVA